MKNKLVKDTMIRDFSVLTCVILAISSVTVLFAIGYWQQRIPLTSGFASQAERLNNGMGTRGKNVQLT